MTNIDNTDIQLQEKSDYHLMIIFERLNTSICKWRQSTHTDLGQIHRLTRCYFPIILIIVIIIIIIIIIIMIIRYLARVRGESGLVPAAFIEIIARCSLDLFYLLCSFAFVKGQSSGFFFTHLTPIHLQP